MTATEVLPPTEITPAPEVTLASGATPEPVVPAARLHEWSLTRRVVFRFLFCYFVLYLFPFPLGSLPIPHNPVQYLGKAQDWLSLWTETHLLGLAKPIPIVPTGSGDTMSQWALQLDWILLALGITLVWSLLNRRRRNYARLEEWLRVYVRFGLATIMFGYGFAKIIPTQMPAPTLDRLVEPWGEFSPMGVLWSFMGYSSVYQIFTGIGEALGSLLLIFRRTVTLGALVLCAVLSNVVLLNYTFDVPVKLFSTNLLFMAIYLAAPDLKRLIGMLVLDRPVAPSGSQPLFASRRANWSAVALGVVFAGYIMWSDAKGSLTYYRTLIGPNAPRHQLYGIWDVEELTKNGVAQPPLLSDSMRLKRVVFSQLSRATLRFMSDSVERYAVKLDSVKHVVTLTGRFDPKLVHTLAYTRVDPTHVVLSGRMRGDSIDLRLRRLDEKRFLLVNRGYHWVQELPFNR